MELSENLINAFADVIAAKEPKRNTENIVYGTVKSVSGKTAQVQFDGAETVTPCVMSMMAEQGDRVRVSIKDHKAVVTGNVSNPATVAKADKYMKFTEDGLVIGGLDDDGNPTGFYILISNDTYFIKDENGNTVASFASSEVNLASGSATIKTENDTLYLLGNNAVGLRATKSDGTKGKITAEAVVGIFKDDNGNDVQRAALQSAWYYKTTDSVPSRSSAVVVDENNVNVSSLGGLTVNGDPVLTTRGFFVQTSTFARGVVIQPYSTKIIHHEYANNSEVPIGRRVVSLNYFEAYNGDNRDPNVHLYYVACGGPTTIEQQESGYYPNFCTIGLHNPTSTVMNLNVIFGCLAIPFDGYTATDTKYIDF